MKSETILIRVPLKLKEKMKELQKKIKEDFEKKVTMTDLYDKFHKHKYFNKIREDIYEFFKK